MREKLLLIGGLNKSLTEAVLDYAQHSDDTWQRKYTKTAIKRRINLLRAELLELERMVENG